MRDLKCDFCSIRIVSGDAWGCPADDFRYREPRIGLDRRGPIVAGSYGAWLACDTCAELVRNGRRDALVRRSLLAHYRTLELPRRLFADVRALHDQFWRQRTGPPARLDSEQLAALAEQPDHLPPP